MSTIQPTTVRPAVKPRPTPPRPAKPAVAKPKPRPRAEAAPLHSSFAERPIFQASNQVGNTIAKPSHPLEAVGGLAVMPVAIAVDVVDLFTRPLQALFTLGR